MDPLTAIGLVTTVIKTAIEVAPVIIKGAGDLKVFGTALFEKFTGGKITPEQRAELEAKIEELHNEFQAPIPPESEQ